MKMLSEVLKKQSTKPGAGKRQTPLWQGPESNDPNGGVTQSALSAWLVCRERFRLKYVEGWAAEERWNHRSSYGDMWHLCEESLAAGKNPANTVDQWEPVKKYVQAQCRQYPLQQQEIVHWYNVLKVQFPLYVDYWRHHPDVQQRTPLFQEQVFNVPYELPSGRTVYIKGKWDSVDVVGKGNNAGVWLMENKTKGDINEELMKRQLAFDLQTMTYLVSLAHSEEIGSAPGRLMGVRYNVIRRPLSGGKGTIKKHQATAGAKCPICKGEGVKNGSRCPKCGGDKRVGAKPEETDAEFYGRLAEYIKTEPETYFMRWQVNITPQDILRFKREFLNPCLEQLCLWYDHQVGINDLDYLSYRMPYGVYSPLLDGGSTDLDEHLLSGGTAGLRRVEHLFGELR